MAVNTQSFTTLVENIVNTIQRTAAAMLDSTVGSVLRALVEAFAGQLLWLQAQLLALLATTRAATSSGSDLDSWMADYGCVRGQPTSATGVVTLARYTATAPATIAVTGTIANGVVSGTAAVQTQDGALQYAILADTTNSYFNSVLGVYAIPGGTASIPVLVGCLSTGTAGNAGASAINTLATPLPGVDTVTNAAALTDAQDVQSDAEFRLAFQAYLASLAKATRAAVTDAVTSVQPGASCAVFEYTDYSTGATRPGYFYVVADDGSGSPGSTFLQTAYAAVDAVRPLTSVFELHGPTLVAANISLSISLAAGYDTVATPAAAQAALAAYIAALPLGAGLPFSRLAQVVYDSSDGIVNVTGMVLSCSISGFITNSDIPAVPQNIVRPGTISVSVTA